MEESTNIELIDAVNLICEYVGSNLPEHWEIKLNMSSIECTMDLISPDGRDVEYETERGLSALRSIVETARNNNKL